MNKALQVALGIMTSIGGFLDIGAIATNAEAGASFGYGLIWALLLGTVCLIFLVEMTGRLTAVSKHPLAAAIRERFGFRYFLIPLISELLLDVFILAAEIGGVSIALELITGIGHQVWAVPVAAVVWLLIWRGSFSLIENGVALLGLITLAFVVGAFKLHPQLPALAAGLLPRLPGHDTAHYLYIAVGIIGAIISPYLLYFYSSGAIEDKWDEGYLGVNRATAGLGMGFGAFVALGVLVCAALVLHPAGIRVDSYQQAALTLVGPLGRWGLPLFAASLGIACLGAALEINLSSAYIVAQAFGWKWGADQKPTRAARFSLTYTIFLVLAVLPIVLGVDPLQLTLLTAAVTSLLLPFIIVPLLLLMNDRVYLGRHTNGWIGNAVVLFIALLAAVLALVALPLQFLGG